MRRKPYLSLLLALVILGGMLALFPTVWMVLAIALLALVALQVAVVRRHLYSLPPGHTQVIVPSGTAPARPAPPEPSGEAAAAADTTPGAAAGGPAAGEAPAGGEAVAPTPSAPRPDIDTELFSRFRQHLEEVEAETDGTAPPRPTPPPPDEGEVQDRVELSGAARRPPVRPAAPRPAMPKPPASPPATSQPPVPRTRPAASAAEAGEAEGSDIFADLRPTPVTPPPQEPAPALNAPKAATPPQAEPSTEGTAPATLPEPKPTPAATARPAQRAPADKDAAPPDEVSAALAGDGGAGPGLADEAATLLRLAEEAAGRDDWEGLRAGLDNYLAHLAEAPGLVDWRARRQQVRLAIHDQDTNRALQGFEELLATGHRPPVDEVPPLLDELLAGADRETAASLRVSMLVRILAVFRQARDQRAMDRCYGWIEEAQEQVGDERRLLQYLKNHLEIRKVLGDLPGQLELIDQLGNRCYRLGLTEDAKAYYEMGLRLRAEAEQPLPPGGALREG
ncbi:MAG TPA: hypothetical protein VKB51_10360 [bacterium]|nr:hypothetical protein [bacterium]